MLLFCCNSIISSYRLYLNCASCCLCIDRDTFRNCLFYFERYTKINNLFRKKNNKGVQKEYTKKYFNVIVILIHLSMLSISISYNDPSIIVTTMHRREQTTYLQFINKKKRKTKVTYLRIYKMENCLDVVGLDL